jgi:hypothetical protein
VAAAPGQREEAGHPMSEVAQGPGDARAGPCAKGGAEVAVLLTRIGAQLPAGSSALVTFAETRDSRGLLKATVAHGPATASVAAIGEDLGARVFAGATDPSKSRAAPGGVRSRPASPRRRA